MTQKKSGAKLFQSAADDLVHSRDPQTTEQSRSPAYQLAYDDLDFVLRDEMRPVRLLMELSKPELGFQEQGIENTVVMFGSARIAEGEKAQQRYEQLQQKLSQSPGDADLKLRCAQAQRRQDYVRYYEQARSLATLISDESGGNGLPRLHVVTGGGPGIMEAANRGASDIGRASVGLNIVLPEEQSPNDYITPSLCFRFHYFAMRKLHFLLRAKALVVFPGGFGTLDELFETLTLMQTQKIKPLPILLFGREYWQRLIDFNFLLAEGMVS